MRPGRGDWDGTMALDNGVPLWPVVVALLDGGPEEAQFARHGPRRHRWLVQVAYTCDMKWLMGRAPPAAMRRDRSEVKEASERPKASGSGGARWIIYTVASSRSGYVDCGANNWVLVLRHPVPARKPERTSLH